MGVVLANAQDCPRVDAAIALAFVATVAGLGWARRAERRMRAAA